MDLSNAITMDKDEAEQKAKAYREIKAPSDEDQRLVLGQRPG